MTVEELKKIWEPARPGQNHQLEPDQSQTGLMRRSSCSGRASDSGTFDYFTEAMVGKAKSSRGDYTASEDDNVLVQGVSRDKGMRWGISAFSYYAENSKKLKAVAIVEKAGKPGVLPQFETVKNGTYQPLSRPLFIYVSAKSADKPESERVRRVLPDEAPKLVERGQVYAFAGQGLRDGREQFPKRPGTGFGGSARSRRIGGRN